MYVIIAQGMASSSETPPPATSALFVERGKMTNDPAGKSLDAVLTRLRIFLYVFFLVCMGNEYASCN